MTTATQETMPGTLQERLDGLRAPLRNLKTVADTKRRRLDELGIMLLDDDDLKLRKERAEIQADLSSVPSQIAHLQKTENAAVAALLARESDRVQHELREACGESTALERELRTIINKLNDGGTRLPEPQQSQRRAELSAAYDGQYPAFAEIQRKIQRLRVEECILIQEKQAAAVANRGPRTWVY